MNQNNVAVQGICPLKCSAILSFHVVCHSSRWGSSRTHSGSHHLRSFRRQVLPDRVPAHSQISCDTSGGHSLKLGAMDRLPPRPLSPIGFPAQHVDWMPRSIGPVKGRLVAASCAYLSFHPFSSGACGAPPFKLRRSPGRGGASCDGMMRPSCCTRRVRSSPSSTSTLAPA